MAVRSEIPASILEPPADASGRAAAAAGFADEAGHRRAIDRYVLAAWLGVDPGVAPAPDAGLDLRLWHALASGAGLKGFSGLLEGDGPLTAERASIGIEIWTETELACLHAFGRMIRTEAEIARLDRAVSWHLETLQPDNATNHPWAMHVWIDAAGRRPAIEAEALMHAEGMLHAAMAVRGRVDTFGALLLLDAARELGRV